MVLVTRDESTNAQCSLCSRKSEDVTTAELGDWIVRDGGILVCSECASDADRAAVAEALRRAEQDEDPPARVAQQRR